MNVNLFKKEKLYVILFFTVLTVILTWPTAWQFFSSVPSTGSDTMQVIGVAGEKANVLSDKGLIGGTIDLIKRSEFSMTTLYAYFQLVFGRMAGYNLLFFETFILSGLGAFLLAFYFTKNRAASILAGIIFAFSPFHMHNSLGTNVGTMHQEWLPFFALYLFKFFEDFKLKNFALAGFFLLLIGVTEHQLLAFTVIFILFFLLYKLITEPRKFLRPKFWIYAGASALILSVVFFFMFRNLLAIAGSENNFLDAGLKEAVQYSNDTLSILIPPNLHTFWPESFLNIRTEFERRSNSHFSVYAGYLVLLLFLIGVGSIRYLRKRNIPIKGIFFWFAVAIGFYVLSLGPYLHYRGVLEPPVKMPYFLIYEYLPFYKNIRTVGRMYVWSLVGFSVVAAWGALCLQKILQKKVPSKNLKLESGEAETMEKQKLKTVWRQFYTKTNILFAVLSIVIILEYAAIPLKTNSLAHSSFYEKLGEEKEVYNVLEVPGSTSHSFASRDLVWRSIHRKNTINGVDFARVNKYAFVMQRGTPIIHTLLYDIPEGSNGNDRDILKNSYYDISNEILNYYNIRWLIFDKEGLRGNPEKGDPNLIYSSKAYVANVIKCADEYEDEYLYACMVDQTDEPEHVFLAMDFSNSHWVGKSESKNGLQRWAENGAGLKLVNMSNAPQNKRLNFNLKVEKPLRLKVFLNGTEIFNEYISEIKSKHGIKADLAGINPGENSITFGVYAADNSEIKSEKKSDTARIYQVEVE